MYMGVYAVTLLHPAMLAAHPLLLRTVQHGKKAKHKKCKTKIIKKKTPGHSQMCKYTSFSSIRIT